MFMCTISRGKDNRSRGKNEFQMFSLISGRHVGVPRRDTSGTLRTGSKGKNRKKKL